MTKYERVSTVGLLHVRRLLDVHMASWSRDTKQMQCLTITLNAAVDTTLWLDRFERGRLNRVAREVMAAGGKGNNVAKALHSVGRSITASGFSGPSRRHDRWRRTGHWRDRSNRRVHLK